MRTCNFALLYATRELLLENYVKRQHEYDGDCCAEECTQYRQCNADTTVSNNLFFRDRGRPPATYFLLNPNQ